MISEKLLRAAPGSHDISELDDGWITSGCWAALVPPRMREKLANAKAAKTTKNLREGLICRAKEVRRGGWLGGPATHRVFDAPGGKCVVAESMAKLLDGYRIVRIGRKKLAPLAGLNAKGEMVLICMPTSIESREVKS